MTQQFCTLTKNEILSEIEKRNILVVPILEKNQIHSAHMDLRLGNIFAKKHSLFILENLFLD